MADNRHKYIVDGVDLFSIRNRNEIRVIQCMDEMLESMKDQYFSEKKLQDVFAYALNRLPARYAQSGTIVLREPVRKEVIEKAVKKAFKVILNNPKD